MNVSHVMSCDACKLFNGSKFMINLHSILFLRIFNYEIFHDILVDSDFRHMMAGVVKTLFSGRDPDYTIHWRRVSARQGIGGGEFQLKSSSVS